MLVSEESTPAQWYERAVRCHVEEHQGCPWCGGRHCVFRSPRGERVEYTCTECDFFACHNHQTNCFYAAQGRVATAP
jgi:hypothetical protein